MKKRHILTVLGVCLASAYFVLQSGAMSSSADNTASYAQDVQPIFNARCDNCHMGNYPSEGLNLGSYETLMAGSQNGTVIVPGNANESLLVKMVAEGEMPKRGPHLTEAQIQLLTDWVNAGAPNN